MNQIGFGGGCHWCTEAVFQSLRGVLKVEQGWIASTPPNDVLSEAVLVTYNEEIELHDLVEIHLLTHSSANDHSMRSKYRSAIYYFNNSDADLIKATIRNLSLKNDLHYITQALPFDRFELNAESFLNYYQRNKTAPFCETYIHPKLTLIKEKFASKARANF